MTCSGVSRGGTSTGLPSPARSTRAGQYPNRSLRSPYPQISPALASALRSAPIAATTASSQATLAGP